MSIAEFCVKRPVFTTMLVALFVVTGVFSFRDLSVDLLPKADPAVVQVLINLPGAGTTGINLTGKTITVHLAADPGCSADLYLSLVVNTTAGAYYFSPPLQVRPITNMWKTATATVTADAGTMSALALSLQAFSVTGYTGKIYVDEIDIR